MWRNDLRGRSHFLFLHLLSLPDSGKADAENGGIAWQR